VSLNVGDPEKEYLTKGEYKNGADGHGGREEKAVGADRPPM
jgi:hypothetical protein